MDNKALFDAIRVVKGASLTQADVDRINVALASINKPAAPTPEPLAWGAKVSPEFRERVRLMAKRLGGRCTPSDYMACMAWESDEKFSASVKNMAGSGAVGLIQFMPSTALDLGTTTRELASMSALRQLDYVELYFTRYKGRLNTLADLYMAILWPKAIGAPMDAPLWDKASRPTTYRQNAGLDMNRDGTITKAEAAGKVYAKLERGLLAEFRA